MKKISVSFAAIAGLAAIGGALAFTPHANFHHNFVYAQQGVGTVYFYSNAPGSLSCQGFSAATFCTISTTATAAYLNSKFPNSIPALQPHTATQPEITALVDANSLYQPE
jgi:hypothetical protein